MSDGVDHSKRRTLTIAAGAMGGVGAAFVAVPFVSSMLPSAKAQAAGAPVEVDVSRMEPGQRITAEWRGKPVWVIRRTKDQLKGMDGLVPLLRDPNSEMPMQPDYAQNPYRSIRDEYAVIVGICTHLGCSPTFRPEVAPADLGEDWVGGFFCPCHGSKFDLAGRVYNGAPAPKNLEVPRHKFISDSVIFVGADDQGVA
ncbi:MAG: ubiquinol-cytochrome c reductase iron-sulfur subunit [Gammaproteobacteria bacterium]|nr:ubiquinol-cytochrome c reductase iron-sulfur subunit [Gammaproteobacteria bacterium]